MSDDPRPDDSLDELNEAVSALLRAERRLRVRPREGLTFNHVRALQGLWRADGRGTPGQIARETGLNPASVTGLLDQLQDRGFIDRARSTTDRRVVEVTLTASGEAFLLDERAQWRRRWEAGLRDVAGPDRRVAADVVRRITVLLEDLGREQPEVS